MYIWLFLLANNTPALKNPTRVIPLLAAVLLAACTTQPDPAAQAAAAAPLRSAPDSVLPEPPAAPVAAVVLKPADEAPPAADTAADSSGEYETVYVVIADTSRQYRPLRQQMLRLQAATRQRIDTLGRFYDPKKNLIRLPDTAPAGDEKTFDEMYAGEYYPRRMPDATLSVEYADQYLTARPKSMALVMGIYEQPARADSLLAVVRRTAPAAFRVKTSVYMGCLH